MTVYQLHEYGGMWEDRYDFLIGTYASLDRALMEKEQLEKEKEETEKCNFCPLYMCEDDCDYDCDKCMNTDTEKIKEYCDDYVPYIHGNGMVGCSNRRYTYDSALFRIDEIDVIE